MNILHIDIETSPNLAHVWGLFKQNVGISQLQDSSRVMCFAAKLHGQKEVFFSSEHETDHAKMIKAAWTLLDEADVVVHYNGQKFDIPTLNKEFIQYGMSPPSPYKQVDLLLVAKRQFKFPSNKLDYVAKALGLGQKVKHVGHQLWVDCMAGDDKAWKTMERYNKQDVKLLEKVYKKMLPWITAHPNVALYVDDTRPTCTNCGSHHVHRRGVEHTKTHSYRRYQCTKCNTWMRSRFNTKSKRADDNEVMVQVK